MKVITVEMITSGMEDLHWMCVHLDHMLCFVFSQSLGIGSFRKVALFLLAPLLQECHNVHCPPSSLPGYIL